MTRTTRRLAAAGLAVLLLAGCGGAQARAGAAATVGDERISAEELEQLVERGLQDPQAEQQFGQARADYQRQVLNRMIRAELLEDAARENDVEVTRGDVDAQLAEFAEQAGGREELEQQAAAGGIHPRDLPSFAREITLEIALGDALTEDLDVPDEQLQSLYEQRAAQFDRVTTRHILVEDEAQARDLLAQVQADRERFPELAAEFSIDESNAEDGGDLGTTGRGQFVEEFDSAVFAAQPGELLVVQTSFGWHVVEVLDRETTPLEEAEPELRRQVLGEQRAALVREELREAADRLGVEVNPRFGRWDEEAVQVAPVPEEDGLSKPAPDDGAGGDVGELQPGTDGSAPQGQAPEGSGPEGSAPQGEPSPAPQ